MEGSFRPKKLLKKCMELNWNIQRGGEVLGKIPSVGEVWTFSGTTHSVLVKIKANEVNFASMETLRPQGRRKD